MNRIKHLHILHYTSFTIPFIKLIQDNFNKAEHFFAIYRGKNHNDELKKIENSWCGNKLLDLIRLSQLMNGSTHIYLHSINVHKPTQLLFLQPWLLKRTFWVIWGGDLLAYQNKRQGLYAHLNEYIRRKVIRKLYGIITHTLGDYNTAQKVYNTRAKYYECVYYPDAFPHLNLPPKQPEKKNNKQVKKILLGNSASRSNEHLSLIRRLSANKVQDFEIFCPLSYGDKQYAKEVIEFGTKLFGDRFHPIVDFMPIEEYYLFLEQMDIAFFNFGRQQGLGNIITLLYLGKKVYIKTDTALSELLKRKNLNFFNIEDFESDFMQSLSDDSAIENFESVTTSFSKEKSLTDWQKIFIGE